MNYFTFKDLKSEICNLTNLVELNHDEGSIIISEYGGRVLGLFPLINEYSLLWINPSIKSSIESKDFLIGGERYWISPERTYFYKDPENFKEWFCPNGIDPANYVITKSSQNECILASKISLINQFNKERYNGEITRKIRLINEPINIGLNYIGIEIIEDCIVDVQNIEMNGWSLAQCITGGANSPGTVLIPTKTNPKLLSYFRIIPDDRREIGENYIAFKIDAADIYKLAVRPEDIDFNRSAKIGYFLKIPNSDKYGFLIKLSDDIPKNQDQCFDVARDRHDSERGVIQSYNDESSSPSIVSFGEIELQLNSFTTWKNGSRSTAKHELFGYIGEKEEIFDVIAKYLGINNPKIY
ncbi:MAG: DUF6786 family protein [Promethearchaeota archaeon]